MPVSVDAPRITLTGSMPNITVNVVTGTGSGGTSVHNELTGRSTADAHPVSAITGLQAALDAIGAESVPDYSNWVAASIIGFGGSFPTADTALIPGPDEGVVGAKVLLTSQASGANNDGWVVTGSEPLGGGFHMVEFAREDPSPLRSERIGTLITAPNALGGGADSVLRVTGVGTVEVLTVTAAQVQALIDAEGFATPEDLEALTDSIGDAVALHDYRGHEERLGLIDTPEFIKGAGDSQTDAWRSPADAVPTESYAIISTGRVTTLAGASWFHELAHRGMDAGVGQADSIEFAIREWDGATYPPGSDVLPPKGALWLYAEGTNQASGAAWESGDPLPETWQINVDADIKLGCWFTVCEYHDLTTGTVTLYREVDCGGVELFGRRWRQVAQIVEPVDAGSVYLDPAEPWAFGVRFKGAMRETEVYIDDVLAYNPKATDWVSGSTFADGEGNTWTTTTGTVVASTGELVDALEAADTALDGRIDTLETGWRVIHKETLASDTASRQVTVTGYSRVQVIYTGRSTRNGTTDNVLLTINNDTSSIYSTDAAAVTTSLSIGNIPGMSTNSDRWGHCEADLHLISGAMKAGFTRTTNIASTATVGAAPVQKGLFVASTAAVTTIEIKANLGSLAAGGQIIVLGMT